ncbi:hypothetical protein BT63DRAFT_415448 [Microthyrium microscopicum]|uniref:Pentatricopeptide repeat protein n=1 Tax=Microthyrium microscopicum TaxID=703497 RepID=A0A6A6U6X9_9PEZI|nr:hypothetical protein BT63DRAFT_415448 [Microthyrium microscopicum]
MALRGLWTRICQFGCSCSACRAQHGPPQSARNGYQSMRSKAFPTSTYVYTMIFGYATAIDTVRRVQRRKQWEEAIAQKKKEVEAAEEAVAQRAQELLKARFGITVEDPALGNTKDSPLEALKSLENTDSKIIQLASENEVLEVQFSKVSKDHASRNSKEIQSGHSAIDALHSLEAELADAHDAVEAIERDRDSQSGNRLGSFSLYRWKPEMPSAPNIPGREGVAVHNLPPQSPWARPRPRHLGPPARWTWKKLRTVEICTARLVLQLFQIAGFTDQPREIVESLPQSVQHYASLSRQQSDFALQQLELELFRLHSFVNDEDEPLAHLQFDVPIPRFNPNHSFETKSLLKLSSIFHEKGAITPSTIARISAELLASEEPPTIHTVNCIFTAFLRHKRLELTEPLVSMLFDANLRPNEITCSSVLRHYRRAGDGDQFMQYIKLMRGQDRGLMLAKPWFKTINNLHKSQGRCFMLGTNKVVQATVPSPLTFLEIVLGLVQFAGLDTAWKFSLDLMPFGWTLDFPCIYILMFQAGVDATYDYCHEIWRQADRLSIHGHSIPKRLYALAIAVHHMEDQPDRCLTLFKESSNLYPDSEIEMMEMARERIKLIKQYRLVNKAAEMNVQSSDMQKAN